KGSSFDFEIAAFVEKYNTNALLTVNTLKILEQEEVLQFSEQFFSPATVEFLAGKSNLEHFESSYPSYNSIIKGLLRSYEGIMEQPVFIDEFTLAKFISSSKEDVIKKLTELHNFRILDYNPRKDKPQIYFP